MEIDEEGASGRDAVGACGAPAPSAAPLAPPVLPPASLRPAEPLPEDLPAPRSSPMPRQASAVTRERLRSLPQ
eukprot:9257586-Alexandrium_andersonii.AAC.1